MSEGRASDFSGLAPLFQGCESLICADALTMTSGNMAFEIEAVRQAAYAWCKKNDVPVSFFSGPLSIHPLTEEQKLPEQYELKDIAGSLEMMTSAFDAVTML